MDILLQILTYTVPSLLVLVVAYFTLHLVFKNEEKRRRYELFKANVSLVTPVRLTAYERLVLFLERISPDSLMIRVQDSSLTAGQFHSFLLATVRSEYEHNLSQQVYVSREAWTLVKNAKESMIQLINTSSSRVPPQVPSLELAKVILETYQSTDSDTPTVFAINFIKGEVKQYFG
ncbi:MAG: hypothetical protein KA397_04635 [Paludibacteraceae bacterium]|nr:hypothetical protein [Paludibacteraceae bacterium]MBP6284248.1 hypothetical protein [Paludibacteraceae bacterium]